MRKILAGTFAASLLALSSAAWAQGSAEELFAEGVRLEKNNQEQQAVKAYQAFLDKFPDHSQATEALYRQAKCMDALGLVEQAIPKLEKASKADPKTFRNRGEALFLLGKMYAAQKEYPKANETYEKLLGQGAGLNEDEVLSLSAAWYAQQNKHNEAAAKLNILKRKRGSSMAEAASYKLVLLWIKADRLDDAVAAIQDLADAFPKSELLPDVLLKTAHAYRLAGKVDKVLALCAQIRQSYPRSPEALAANYLLGMCYRDRKEFKEAVKVLEEVGKSAATATRLISADALCQTAEIYRSDLNDVDKALRFYEEAAMLARECEGERRNQILETAWFHLAESYFAKKKYATALEFYTQLRNLGTKANILGRIVACQKELKMLDANPQFLPKDLEELKARKDANAGTAIAADIDVFLLDRRLNDLQRGRQPFAQLAPDYEKVAGSYKPEVLASNGLDVYVYTQAGICWASSTIRTDFDKALVNFNKAMALAKDNISNKITCLENIAVAAERFGKKDLARKTYEELFQIQKGRAEKSPEDKALAAKAADMLKVVLTRADSPDAIAQSLAMAQKVIEEKGALSEMGRAAKFYIGELYYLKKDFSNAAKSFREFISIYGPKQDPESDIVGAPWAPPVFNDQTDQIYEAAIRIAHAWYLQGHEQNMVKAYQWIVRNIPRNNRYLPEAKYWLAMELIKGKKGETKDAKRKFAEEIWKGVVGTSLDFGAKNFTSTLHPWLRSGGDNDDRNEEAREYVRSAIMRAGQAWSESDDHDSAAAAFQLFLRLYQPRRMGSKGSTTDTPDDMYSTARYALGREAIALKSPTRLIEAYKPYLSGLRDDRFRISALKLLGYHCAKAQQYDTAIEAYATLIDEYGTNTMDTKGVPQPVPQADRLRGNSQGWSGYRMAPPPGLNFGEMRYALGFISWSREDFPRAVIALKPFLNDPSLRNNQFRADSLYMAGRSALKIWDYNAGTPFLVALIREYPTYKAVEEAYVHAARGLVETRQYTDLEVTYRTFMKTWPQSEWREHMNLAYANGLLAQGRSSQGLPVLKTLAERGALSDTRADALYALGLEMLKEGEKSLPQASRYFDDSVKILAREASLLEAARAAYKLKQLDKARGHIDRITSEFPRGRKSVLEQAQSLGVEIERARMKNGGK